jgi:phosphoserine phosphatase
MSFLLTAVASEDDLPLTEAVLDLLRGCLAMKIGGLHWLAKSKAAEIELPGAPTHAQRLALEAAFAPGRVDFYIESTAIPRRKKLLVADMDNTMIVGETLDELAEQCGVKDQVAAITERTMRGELDFCQALRERVAMLAGLPEKALASTLAEIRPMPGAEILLRTMRAHGACCVLVSGGFNCFTGPVATRLGFHAHHGNILEIERGYLTGRVVEPILDYAVKRSLLLRHLFDRGLQAADCLAIGDGANDYAMLAAAGSGVGFHPKPFLKARVANSILHGDLTVLLYAQGYAEF